MHKNGITFLSFIEVKNKHQLQQCTINSNNYFVDQNIIHEPLIVFYAICAFDHTAQFKLCPNNLVIIESTVICILEK